VTRVRIPAGAPPLVPCYNARTPEAPIHRPAARKFALENVDGLTLTLVAARAYHPNRFILYGTFGHLFTKPASTSGK
jgi:hypothetical protein